MAFLRVPVLQLWKHSCQNYHFRLNQVINNHTLAMATNTPFGAVGTVKKFTVCVEGNIASGKSTLLEYFQQHQHIKTLPEPVNEWRDINGHNVLKLMYDDPSRWSFTFHSYVQLSMLKNHALPHPENVFFKVMERSIYSGRYCFIENLKINKKLPDVDYEVLDQWHKWMASSNNVKIDRIIYLRSSPEICFERIKKRSRSEESNISLEYLENLHELHEQWLMEQKFFVPAPITVINADLDTEDMSQFYERIDIDLLHGKGNLATSPAIKTN